MNPRKMLLLSGGLLLAAGCADLDVVNPNQPDTDRVLASPEDVQALVGGAYNVWWTANHSSDIGWITNTAIGPALSVAADAHSSSWGNFFMREISSEPRVALVNSPSHAYANVLEWAWYQNYAALKSANDGLRAMDEGLDLGKNEAMVRAWAKFIQGISHGQLALTFDQAFIFDESIGPDEVIAGLDLSPYSEVMAAAISQLEEAASIAESNTFTTPGSWLNGTTLSSGELARLAHSYIARFLAGVARTPAERESVNWQRVIAEADKGITKDFGPLGDKAFWEGPWWDVLKSFGGVYPGWARMDLRFYGMADTDGDYQAWLAQPVAQRTQFLINTPDRRITGAGGPQTDGTHVIFAGNCPFRAERGTYHCSQYADGRWLEYAETNSGMMTEFMVREVRLLKAEGLMRTGNEAGAAEIINETRVPAGLPPVTAAGVPDSPDCVPQAPTTTKQCGTLLRALHWEKWVETYHTGVGTEFTDARGWGWLVPGSAIHIPIPAKELEVLGIPIYTFGGSGEGAAGSLGVSSSFSFGKLSVTPDALREGRPRSGGRSVSKTKQ